MWHNRKKYIINISVNVLFTIIIIASAAVIAFKSPDLLLPSLIRGGENTLKMGATLFTIYAVWISLSRLAEKSGLSGYAARALRPVARRVFATDDEKATQNLAMNLSCNLLGIGGAATPYAVKAIADLEREKNDFAQKLLFVINATSIQILPTTVITLRAAAGSSAPFDIFLPSLIATAFSTFTAAGIFIASYKIKARRRARA